LLVVALGVGGAQQSTQDLCAPLTRTLDYLENLFYQPSRLDRDAAVVEALKGLVDHLDDPYTEFLAPEEFEQFQDSLEGQFSGVGIEIAIRDDRLTVIAPLAETPAEAAGVRAGDLILRIDGESTDGITLTEAAVRIRGEPGTTVTLTVRHTDGQEEDIPIVRATITVEPLETTLLEEDGILQLRVLRFGSDVERDVQEALLGADLENLNGIILDLRNNPGGELDAAIDLADLFVDQGVLVSTRSRIYGDETYAASGASTAIPNLPLAVLINEGTASASEIVSGAIRDNDMGILIGRKSFGKGVIQRIYQDPGFPIGSALKITIGEYFTPLGNAVQEVGLTPDIEVSEEEDPVDVAVAWILENAGARMPMPIGSGSTP
jgi:carboxyl-terminal processing protease